MEKIIYKEYSATGGGTVAGYNWEVGGQEVIDILFIVIDILPVIPGQ